MTRAVLIAGLPFASAAILALMPDGPRGPSGRERSPALEVKRIAPRLEVRVEASPPSERPAAAHAPRPREASPPEESPRGQGIVAKPTSRRGLVEVARDPIPSPEERAAALLALAGFPEDDPDLVATALASLTDPAPEVRRGAVLALVNRRGVSGKCVPALAGVLGRDHDPVVRREAAFVLGTLGDSAAVPALRDASVRDPEPQVVEAALEGLKALAPEGR